MSYITNQERREIDKHIEKLSDGLHKVGQYNYAITKLLLNYINKIGGKNDSGINAAVGILECAKLEFYRRVSAPYEHHRMLDNGDVYE